MKALVIAQLQENRLTGEIYQLVTAAKQLGQVDILVAGAATKQAAEEASRIEGVHTVWESTAAHYEHQLAEEIAALIQSLAKPYQYVLASANTFGKNLLPRAAALLDRPMISEVIEIKDKQIFVHPIYAGSILETVLVEGPVFLTIRKTSFEASTIGGQAEVVSLDPLPALGLSTWIKHEGSDKDRPQLAHAEVVVAGGRGLGSQENFVRLLTPLAEILQAAIGASRAAVDAQYAPNDYQVGQTGKVVAPDLYIAVGISGALQHLAGMQDSRIVVAINKDPDAPILKIADYAMVGDLFEIVPQLVQALKQSN
ncbi:MAG: FAD-binding protein [Neisseriaceae bacterium]